MQKTHKPENKEITSDPVPERGWERQPDQRTHYQTHDHQGEQDPSPAKRRVGAWVAMIAVLLVVFFVLLFFYMIP